MVELSKRLEIAAGAGASSPEGIKDRIDQGVKYISYGPDYSLLSVVAKTGVDAFKELTK